MFSGAEIKALGKRLRDNNYGKDDIGKLETFRMSYDNLLLSTSERVFGTLRRSGVSFVSAGRSKRVKSIIRKLARPENKGMDLSRMADIVGLRVIVLDLVAQDATVKVLQNEFSDAKLVDYREGERLYRSIHFTVREDTGFRAVEVQIRTVAQQLWANESESFGEQVKEGGGSADIQAYLRQLSYACRSLDYGKLLSPEDLAATYFETRGTLSSKLPLLARLFDEAVKTPSGQPPNGSYIVVYDNEANRLIQQLAFEPHERELAISDYQRLSSTLDEARYETLILNSNSNAVLQVTHSRFFPE